jgi:hypothetical protein
VTDAPWPGVALEPPVPDEWDEAWRAWTDPQFWLFVRDRLVGDPWYAEDR